MGLIDSGAALQFAQPKRMNNVYDVAIGPTGPLVFAGRSYDDGDNIVATLAGRRLAPLGGDLEAGSLTVTEALVTWRTTDGRAHSAPLG